MSVVQMPSSEGPDPAPDFAGSIQQAVVSLLRLGVLDLSEAAGAFHEAHEDFEALWRGCGRSSAEGQLLQALVQLCASELKRCAGGRAAGRLAARAAGHLDALLDVVLGVRAAKLAARIRSPARPVRVPLAHPLDAPGELG